MRWCRPYLTAAGVSLALAAVIAVSVPELTSGVETSHAPRQLAQRIAAASAADTAERTLPGEFSARSARAASERMAGDGSQALLRTRETPELSSTDPIESGLATLLRASREKGGDTLVRQAFARLPDSVTAWWTVLYPEQIGNLTGAAYPERARANRIRVAAAITESAQWPTPARPWTNRERPARAELERLLAPDIQLLYFDPLANGGHGAWAEIRGDLETADHVGVMVPGGSAFLTSENHIRYRYRADTLVAASHGELAMIVWAGDAFPSGWVAEANPHWAQHTAPKLRAFVNDLHARLPARVKVTLLGHSYGGAVVGLAETGWLEVDQVLHVASAGAGFGVEGAGDYSQPCRPRFVMMAPGDPIGYAQDLPAATGLGHGVPVAELGGSIALTTGRLPADPAALDDVGRSLGSQGIAGERIGGIHAHSEVFIPDSEAWDNIRAVLTDTNPRVAGRTQPPPECR